ncbi:MAG: transposase, partial [Candidatus Hydrogenedentes bacterium]|nr:transposase [Candidatus Hydrogenedentota bacterium]
MPFDFARARPLLQDFKLRQLFVEELGWEPSRQQMDMAVGEQSFLLTSVAEKKRMVVWQCESKDGQLPDHGTRLKLDRQVTQTTFEHLLVFVTRDRARQSWVWVRREPGRPVSARTHEYLRGQPGDSLLQKLQHLFVSLDEEEAGLSVAEMAARARAAFNIDRVVKRFYEQFRKEHAAFLKFIEGIPDTADHEWYASVMLNRLMFVYFVQRKGFLDGDPNYLRNRLQHMRKEHGKDKFYSFYRYFLLRLFHEGLGGRERSPELDKLLGKIPYLNGGIFDIHELERPERYGKDIQIPDSAFQRIFDFFDQWNWHLDDRPLRADNEINPDVLGYIYEKYINQKQMGAYYTKEDITEYISKNTVIPFLFDAARARCKVAFENPGGPTVWDLLKNDPDRYIYPAVRHGADLPLPPEVENGVNSPTLHQPVGEGPILTLELRKEWNKPAPAEYALPTEIWREVVARRQRYEEIKKRLAGSSVSQTSSSAHSRTADRMSATPEPADETSATARYFVFKPFDKRVEVEKTQRRLPHWHQPGVTYFVTWRLFDAVSQQQLAVWTHERNQWLAHHPKPWTPQEEAEYWSNFQKRQEEYLDNGYGECILARPDVGPIVAEALTHFDDDRYDLGPFIVMPNHVHVLVAPRDEHSLSDVLQAWKGYTAKQINRTLGRSGTMWWDESFDHIVRSFDDYERFARYIQTNPKKAGLQAGVAIYGRGAKVWVQALPVSQTAPSAGSNTAIKMSGTQGSADGTSTTHGVTDRPADETSATPTDINDLITLNLDIRQFAQDVIETCEGPELLRAFWHAIEKVTILDPTCGSGAFLFAALDTLEPLYEAILDRMEAFLQDEAAKLVSQTSSSARLKGGRQDVCHTSHGYPLLPHRKYEDFSNILEHVAEHPSRKYFVYKSIILNNLFGVDIMEEAVEICKLRLFLKLAAQVEPDTTKPNYGIEPLPDIDFNIRAGNTLVGFTSMDEIRRVLGDDLVKKLELPAIEEKAAEANRQFRLFREMQTERGMDAKEFTNAKHKLRDRLKALEHELNRFKATDYGFKPGKNDHLDQWVKSHQPFHWFIDFYG